MQAESLEEISMQANNYLVSCRDAEFEVPDTCLFKRSTLTRRHPHTGTWPMGSHGRSASLQPPASIPYQVL